MKIIEAFKQIKDLQRKAEDIRKKIAESSADLDFETPRYENQNLKVRGWAQAHFDIVREITRLKVAIQRTNLAVECTIDLGGKAVTKTLAEWVLRRREMAALDLAAWKAMTTRGLKDGQITQSDNTKRDVKVRRYYDQEEKDKMVDLLQSEPLMIDARLEVVNAVTDIIE